MSMKILNDAEIRPDVFFWKGSIPKERLDEWLQSRKLNIPDDLKMLWMRTGGGEVLESETILGPYGDESLGEDVDSVNEFHHTKGMPDKYLIFHIGVGGLSAIRLSDNKYVQLNEDSYVELQEYSSLERWYEMVLRQEYRSRYELPIN